MSRYRYRYISFLKLTIFARGTVPSDAGILATDPGGGCWVPEAHVISSRSRWTLDPPVNLVGVALQRLHDGERGPVQLGERQPRRVTLLAPVPHTIALGYNGRKPSHISWEKHSYIEFLYLNMSSSVISDSSPLVLYLPWRQFLSQ